MVLLKPEFLTVQILGVAVEGEEKVLLKDIRHGNQLGE